jgi:hypothetical protein
MVAAVQALDLLIDELEASDWMGKFRPGRTVDELANSTCRKAAN